MFLTFFFSNDQYYDDADSDDDGEGVGILVHRFLMIFGFIMHRVLIANGSHFLSLQISLGNLCVRTPRIRPAHRHRQVGAMPHDILQLGA